MTNLSKYEQALERIAARGLPIAMRSTINGNAFATQKAAQQEVGGRMVLRNKWTAQSIQVTQARGSEPARTGSRAAYMADQERGATVRPAKGSNKPIPTSYAAGQEGARPRTRLPRKPNKLSSIRLRRGRTSAAAAAAVREAAASGQRFVYLDTGKRKGLYRITGGKRRPKARMVWDLSRKSVQVKPTHWLRDSTATAMQGWEQRYFAALQYQLRRAGWR